MNLQTPKRDDDIIVKLPIAILFGEESDWEDDERNRMIGDGDVFGHTDNETAEDKEGDTDTGTSDVVLDMNEVNAVEQQDETGEIENTDEPNLNVVTTPEDDLEEDNNNQDIENDNIEEEVASVDDDMD